MAKGFSLNANVVLKGPINVRPVVSAIKKQLNFSTNVNIQISKQAQGQVNQLTRSFKSLTKEIQQTNASVKALNNNLATLGKTLSSLNMSNITTAATAMSKVSKQTKAATNVMYEFGHAGGLAFRRFTAFSLATAPFVGFISLIGDALTRMVSFDKQMIKLSQVSGQTIQQLNTLKNSIFDMATGLGVNSDSLAEVAVTLKQAGLSARDTRIAMEALAEASLAPSFNDINETTEGAIAAMAQFSIKATDLRSVLGSVNAVSQDFAVEAEDIIKAIRIAGGVFASTSKGVSEGKDALNEFMAAFTAVRATTRASAESIATGFNTIFARIQRPQTIEFLKKFGIQLQDLNGRFVGPYEAIQRISEGLKGLDSRDLAFAKIVEELGGFRQLKNVIPLFGEIEKRNLALSTAQRGAGSTAAAAVIAQQSLANQFTKTRESFQKLIYEISETSTFRAMVTAMLEIANAAINMTNAIKPLIPMLGVLASFKVGNFLMQAIPGVVGGLRGKKFASGGIVPGTGNTDSVPARLMPGEFVLRKSAARSIGYDNLVKMNQGGILDQKMVGGVALKPVGKEKHVTGKISIEKDSALGIPAKTYDTFAQSLSEDRYDKYVSAIYDGLISGANTTARKLGFRRLPGKNRKDFLGMLNSSEVGNMFEKLLVLDNKEYLSGADGQRPFDITRGLSGKSRLDFNDIPSGAKYVEVKADFSQITGSEGAKEFKKKIRNQIIYENLQGNTTKAKTIRTNIAKDKQLSSQLSSILPQKKAMGGLSEGDIPALLTPGEYVFNRDAVNRIGVHNLEKMNKYHNGGYVKMNAGGSPPNISMSGGVLAGGNRQGRNIDISVSLLDYKQRLQRASKYAQENGVSMSEAAKATKDHAYIITKINKKTGNISHEFANQERALQQLNRGYKSIGQRIGQMAKGAGSSSMGRFGVAMTTAYMAESMIGRNTSGRGAASGAISGLAGGAATGAEIGAFLGPKGMLAGAIIGGIAGTATGAFSGYKEGSVAEKEAKTTKTLEMFDNSMTAANSALERFNNSGSINDLHSSISGLATAMQHSTTLFKGQEFASNNPSGFLSNYGKAFFKPFGSIFTDLNKENMKSEQAARDKNSEMVEKEVSARVGAQAPFADAMYNRLVEGKLQFKNLGMADMDILAGGTEAGRRAQRYELEAAIESDTAQKKRLQESAELARIAARGQIEEQITNTIELNRKLKALADSANEVTQDFVAFSQRIERAAAGIENMRSINEASISALSGNSGLVNTRKTMTTMFDNPFAFKEAEVKGMFGAAGINMNNPLMSGINDAIAASTRLNDQSYDKLWKEIANYGADENKKSELQNASDKMAELLFGGNTKLKNQFSAAVQQAASERDAKGQILTPQDLQQNMRQLVDNMTKEQLSAAKKYFDTLEKVNDNFLKDLSQVNIFKEQVTQRQLGGLRINNSTRDLINNLTGKNLTFAQARKRDRQEAVLRAGTSNPRDLFNNYMQDVAGRDRIQKELDNQEIGSAKYTELAQELAETTNRISQTKNALESLTDASNVAALAQEKFSKLSSSVEAFKGFIERGKLGGVEERRQQMMGLLSSKLIMGTQKLSGIPAIDAAGVAQTKELIAMYEGLGDSGKALADKMKAKLGKALFGDELAESRRQDALRGGGPSDTTKALEAAVKGVAKSGSGIEILNEIQSAHKTQEQANKFLEQIAANTASQQERNAVNGAAVGAAAVGATQNQRWGGVIYARHGYRPKGRDTVPAMTPNGRPFMLAPGEYVVNPEASKANRNLLDRINSNNLNNRQSQNLERYKLRQQFTGDNAADEYAAYIKNNYRQNAMTRRALATGNTKPSQFGGRRMRVNIPNNQSWSQMIGVGNTNVWSGGQTGATAAPSVSPAISPVNRNNVAQPVARGNGPTGTSNITRPDNKPTQTSGDGTTLFGGHIKNFEVTVASFGKHVERLEALKDMSFTCKLSPVDFNVKVVGDSEFGRALIGQIKDELKNTLLNGLRKVVPFDDAETRQGIINRND